MITIYFDGGAKPNPGIGYGSYEIHYEPLELPALAHRGQWRAPFTSIPNNQAEYLTLWLALQEYLHKFKPTTDEVRVYSDSKLLVEQLNERWKVKDPAIKKLYIKCRWLLDRIPNYSVEWNSRTMNVEKFGH